MKKIILLSCCSIFMVQAMQDIDMQENNEQQATAAHTLTQIPVHIQRQFARQQAQNQTNKKTTIKLPIAKHRTKKK